MLEEYSPTQQAAVHWLPAVSAAISFFCSSALVIHISYRPTRKTYHRLLLGLSFFDILASLTIFTARFLDLDEPSQTCSAVAALQVITGGTAGFYDGCLAILFLLVVKFGTTERVIERYFELPFHVSSFLGSVVVALSAYFLEALNPVSITALCWLSAYPHDCQGDECSRGQRWGSFFEQFSQIVLSLMIVIIVLSNLVIYCQVRKTLGRNQRHSLESRAPLRRRSKPFGPKRQLSMESSTHLSSLDAASRASCEDPPGDRPSRRRLSRETKDRHRRRSSFVDRGANRTRQVAVRSFLFCGGFVITRCFAVIVLETKGSSQGTWWFYICLVLDSIFWPLQGFWDSIIYFRPRYIQWRTAYPLTSRFFAWRKTVFSMEKPDGSTQGRMSQQSRASKAPSVRPPSSEDDELSFSQEVQRSEALSGHLSISLGGASSLSAGVIG